MAKTPLDVEATYARILELLRGALQSSDRGPTEVDEAIGRRRGHLEQVLHGVAELEVRELLKVLQALELDPSQFLGPLVVGSRPRGRPPTSEELLLQLAERVAVPVETLSEEEVESEAEALEETPRRVPAELRALVEEYLDQFQAHSRRVGEEAERGGESARGDATGERGVDAQGGKGGGRKEPERGR